MAEKGLKCDRNDRIWNYVDLSSDEIYMKLSIRCRSIWVYDWQVQNALKTELPEQKKSSSNQKCNRYMHWIEIYLKWTAKFPFYILEILSEWWFSFDIKAKLWCIWYLGFAKSISSQTSFHIAYCIEIRTMYNRIHRKWTWAVSTEQVFDWILCFIQSYEQTSEICVYIFCICQCKWKTKDKATE